MERSLIQAIKDRRSYYQLDKKEVVDKTTLEQILKTALHYVPSAFNSRSTRMVLLTTENHTQLWEIVKAELRKVVPVEQIAASEQKIDSSFKSGYATVLFYEDQQVVDKLQKQFALYADKFPLWAEQTSAMHQFAVWTMIEEAGGGASLQHYNPLIDQAVAQKWGIPLEWRLVAQMPVGNPSAEPQPKAQSDTSESLLIY